MRRIINAAARAAIGAAAMAASATWAGQIDAGTYVLTFDDALGAPTVSTSTGVTTYAFAPYTRAEVANPGVVHLADSFAASISATGGSAFFVRPDASFPIWAAIGISDFHAVPDDQPPPSDAVSPYPSYDSGSRGSAEATAVVTAGSAVVSDRSTLTIDMHSALSQVVENAAAAGASATSAQVTLATQVEGVGSLLNRWYCPGCQYLGPEDPVPALEYLGTWAPNDIDVAATFAPVIHVDGRFVGAVPEPSTFALLAAGLAALSWRGRPWRRGAAPKADRTAS